MLSKLALLLSLIIAQTLCLTYEPQQLGQANTFMFANSTARVFQYEIDFHQFQVVIGNMQGINNIIVSQYKIRDVNQSTNCSSALQGSYCQFYNLQQLPFTTLNQTLRNCLENFYIYVVPSSTIDPANHPSLSIFMSLLPQDKVCNGFLSSSQLMNCAQYKVEPCLMVPDCYTTCGELDCWRGDDTSPFFGIVVPRNISNENAKNLCVYYNSIDQKRCFGCQIYVDIFKFESSSITLAPYEEFILSIILVCIVLMVIIISYYNLALAFRGHPPFKVCSFLPQLLFPRGIRGLGRHNIEEENDNTGVTARDDFKSARAVYKPLASN